MKKLLLITSVLLGGCAAKHVTVPVMQPVEVDRAVLKTCVPPDLLPAPIYPDTKAAIISAQNAAERYRLLFAGRLMRTQRLNELETVVEGCK